MEGVLSELHGFFIAIVSGAIAGILFDIYRISRRAMRPGKFLTALGDLLFPLICGGVMYLFLLFNNYGELRLYVVFGAGVGFYIYKKIVSPLIIRSSLLII